MHSYQIDGRALAFFRLFLSVDLLLDFNEKKIKSMHDVN